MVSVASSILTRRMLLFVLRRADGRLREGQSGDVPENVAQRPAEHYNNESEFDMGWETRGKNGKHRYLYRSERMPGGKIKKVYLGKGHAAELAEQQDAEVRAQREADRSRELEQARSFTAVLDPARSLAKDLDEALRSLTAATLLAGNLHQHRGQWRVRRGR